MCEYLSGRPQTNEALAGRILALEAAINRDIIELCVPSGEPIMDLKKDCRALREWAQGDMETHFTRREWAHVMYPFGQLSFNMDVHDYRLEALMVLCWAGQVLDDEINLPTCSGGEGSEDMEWAINLALSVMEPEHRASLLANTRLRPIHPIWLSRQRAWRDLVNLLIESRDQPLGDLMGCRERMFPELESNQRSIGERTFLPLTAQLNALDWILGLKSDWDAPYLVGYNRAKG